jgi:Ca2+-transporting ATPase
MKEEIFWHTRSVEKTLELLETSIGGLSGMEAGNRLLIYGPNEIHSAKPDSLIRRFGRQFESPLVFILLICTLVVMFMGNYLDGGIIALVLLINAMVGTVQEGRAASTLEALRKFTKTQATVARDGQEIQIQDTELVPGDIVILREGEKVPADCRILEQTSLEANESSITGESLPVEKHAETLSNPTTPLTEQKNMLFRGTLITRGSAKVVVTATGSSTHIGEISEKVALTTHEIPLQTHLKELANILILIVLGFSILLFIIGVWQGTSSVEMFGTVVALAVSVIPEGLPIAVTMVLASGVYRMSKRHALVKKLQAVEALGHIDIIAVDKTGTITKNELAVVRLIIGKSHYTFTGSGYDPEGTVFLDQQPVLVSEVLELTLAAKVFALSSNANVFIKIFKF